MAGLTVPELDQKRFFDDEQKGQIWKKQTKPDGSTPCASCGGHLEFIEADFDHIDPWILGGQTIVENGRAVHREGTCHKRGRAAISAVRA